MLCCIHGVVTFGGEQMNLIMVTEKVVGVAVVISAVTVGVLSIHHGDISLGMLVLLGQAQSLFGYHGHGGALHEATHVAVHQHK